MSESDKLDFLINAVSDITRRLGAGENRMDAIETLLSVVAQKVDSRWYDTRPNWEWLVKEVEEIKAQQRDHTNQLAEVIKLLSHMNAKLNVLNQDVLDVRAGHRELERRVGQ
jgi:chromosome segregation ATPase